LIVALGVPLKFSAVPEPTQRFAGFVVGETTIAVGLEFTVIVPVAFTVPQPPVNGILYENGLPVAEEGVPLIVIVPDAALPVKAAVTPAGKFTAAPMPVAPVVVKVIFVLNGCPTQTVRLGEVLVAVIFAVTVIVPMAFPLPQPPVSGMV